jgi:hypothetical protein
VLWNVPHSGQRELPTFAKEPQLGQYDAPFRVSKLSDISLDEHIILVASDLFAILGFNDY